MLRNHYRISLAVGVLMTLSACTQIDDYMLGKDNTLKPTALTPLKPGLVLQKKWTVPTSKSSQVNADLKLDPVISQNVIYTASKDGFVQATDKNQGTILWTKQFPDHLVSGPAVGEGHIALATSASTMMVLNQRNGELLWKANLTGDALAKPVIVDQQILVKTIDGNLYAFDLKSGEKHWGVDHGSPSLILKASSSPVIFNQLALVGYSDGKLDAVDRATGQIIWQRNIAYSSGGSDVERLVDIDADPVVQGDLVYLASYQGYVGALSLKNGEFTWRKPASIYKNIRVAGRSLYFVDGDSTIWSLDKETGRVKWKQSALKARNLTEPLLIGNRLFVGDKSGFLHGLDVHNGELVSRTQLSAPIVAAPVSSGTSVYVLTTNGQLSRFSVGS